jgi:3-hydroxyisobutyrate dehydrogenase
VTLVTETVGVVGLGLLGQAFVSRLLGAGFKVVGFDIDRAKNTKLAQLGGGAAASVGDLARRCDPIVLAVFNTDQVEDVVERELLPAAGEGSAKIVLCASTCDPERIALLAERVGKRGLRLLETPVSGASSQVARGEGVGLIGGDAEVIRAAEGVLRALFARHFHIGKIGDAGPPNLRLISFWASTAWPWPKAWCLRSGSDLIWTRFSRLRAARRLIRRSWTPRV